MKFFQGKAALITSLVLLFLFPNFLVLLGYTVNESIFLGIVAAVSGGLIVGWSNIEEEEKPPKKEEKKSPEPTSNNQDLTTDRTTDISAKEIHNRSQLIKGVDYEEKFSEREEKTEKSNNQPVFTRSNRKGVSLLSWLLIKKQESSKKRRR